MIDRTQWIDETKLKELNDGVYAHGRVDREDLLAFLRLVDTTDATVIVSEVRDWLTKLHEDPKYDKIVFPQGDINAIIGDLESYGVLQHSTILELRENSVRNLK